MEARTKAIYFDKEFRKCNLTFDAVDWALCLLYMAEHIAEMAPPAQDQRGLLAQQSKVEADAKEDQGEIIP